MSSYILPGLIASMMLQNSFVFLDGIGPQRERSLWTKGILHWDDFLAETRIRGISTDRKFSLDSELSTAMERFHSSDTSYFTSRLPRREYWRCLSDFRDGALYLDIETTGISPRSPITVVGVFDGTHMHTLVRNHNLTRSNLDGLLSKAKIIVTFNGSSFDIPMIESQFPGIVPKVPHIDLKHPLRRIGLLGGLKMIERELDIERDRRVAYMTGEDAVYLWRLWEREGKRNALNLLAEYNTADCRNLRTLADFTYKKLKFSVFEAAIPSGKG